MKKKEKENRVSNVCSVKSCDRCINCNEKRTNNQVTAIQNAIDEVKALYYAEAQSYFFHFTSATPSI